MWKIQLHRVMAVLYYIQIENISTKQSTNIISKRMALCRDVIIHITYYIHTYYIHIMYYIVTNYTYIYII